MEIDSIPHLLDIHLDRGVINDNYQAKTKNKVINIFFVYETSNTVSNVNVRETT